MAPHELSRSGERCWRNNHRVASTPRPHDTWALGIQGPRRPSAGCKGGSSATQPGTPGPVAMKRGASNVPVKDMENVLVLQAAHSGTRNSGRMMALIETGDDTDVGNY